jgi:hypothetical protein
MVAGIFAEDKDYLEFYFPRKRKLPYLGAAHGQLGIIYMMLKAMTVIPSLYTDSDYVGIL